MTIDNVQSLMNRQDGEVPVYAYKRTMNGRKLELVHPRVAAVLSGAACPYRIHEHRSCEQAIHNPDDFAACLGVEIARITKTLFVSEQQGKGRTALLCCSAPVRVDLKRVATALGYGRLQMASEWQLNDRLSYPRHGVSPLGAPPDVPVVFDADLLTFPTVWIGSGVAAIEIEIAPGDLRSICDAAAITGVARIDG